MTDRVLEKRELLEHPNYSQMFLGSVSNCQHLLDRWYLIGCCYFHLVSLLENKSLPRFLPHDGTTWHRHLPVENVPDIDGLV